MGSQLVVNGVEHRTIFSHFRLDLSNGTSGYATVAVLLNEDNSFSYGVSYCSPHDNFSKKTGRDLAIEKAIARDTMPMMFGFQIRFWQFCEILLNLDLATTWSPMWAGKVERITSNKDSWEI